jgi:hypothetical protein
MDGFSLIGTEPFCPRQSDFPVAFCDQLLPWLLEGEIGVVTVGWGDTTHSITSVTDIRGNNWSPAAPVARGQGLSQAIYYLLGPATLDGPLLVAFSSTVSDVWIRQYVFDGPRRPVASVTSSGAGARAGTAPFLVMTASTTPMLLVAACTGCLDPCPSLAPPFGPLGGAFDWPDQGYQDGFTIAPKSIRATISALVTGTSSGAWVMQVVEFTE